MDDTIDKTQEALIKVSKPLMVQDIQLDEGEMEKYAAHVGIVNLQPEMLDRAIRLALSDKKRIAIHDYYDAMYEVRNITSYDQKVKIVFIESAIVPVNPRGKRKSFKEMTVKLFKSGDTLAYTFHKRTGLDFFRQIEPNGIQSIDFINPTQKEKDEKRVKEIRARLRSIHKNAWADVKEKLKLTDEELLKDNGLDEPYTVSVMSKIPRWERERVKKELTEAFDNKAKFHWSKNGTKRDLSIECKVCDDGIYRAWFSSQYAGCGNGDYYLLLNPTTASFHERD